MFTAKTESSCRRRQFWKILLNFWTLLTMALVILDFFSYNRYNRTADTASVIYLAILSIYATDKEFERWTTRFISKFFGEIYIGLWVSLMAVMLAFTLINGDYQLKNEVVATFISVLGIFAITQNSKILYSKKKK